MNRLCVSARARPLAPRSHELCGNYRRRGSTKNACIGAPSHHRHFFVLTIVADITEWTKFFFSFRLAPRFPYVSLLMESASLLFSLSSSSSTCDRVPGWRWETEVKWIRLPSHVMRPLGRMLSQIPYTDTPIRRCETNTATHRKCVSQRIQHTQLRLTGCPFALMSWPLDAHAINVTKSRRWSKLPSIMRNIVTVVVSMTSCIANVAVFGFGARRIPFVGVHHSSQ